MKQYNQEKERKLKQFMQEFGTTVLRTAYLYTKDLSAAEDIYQEVFLKAFKQMDSFRNESNIKTWIVRITINQCKDYMKTSWIKRTFFQLSPKLPENHSQLIEYQTPENIIIHQEREDRVLQHILSLPLTLRQILILYYYHDLDVNEISSLLHIKKSTVTSRLHKARKRLKPFLEHTEYQED